MIEDRDIEDFFFRFKDFDSNMIVVEEFKNHIKKVQGKFEENESSSNNTATTRTVRRGKDRSITYSGDGKRILYEDKE